MSRLWVLLSCIWVAFLVKLALHDTSGLPPWKKAPCNGLRTDVLGHVILGILQTACVIFLGLHALSMCPAYMWEELVASAKSALHMLACPHLASKFATITHRISSSFDHSWRSPGFGGRMVVSFHEWLSRLEITPCVQGSWSLLPEKICRFLELNP